MPFLRWVAQCNFVQKWRLKPSLIHQSLSNRKVFVSIVVSVVSPYSLAKKRTGAGDTCHHHFWHRFKSTKNSFFFHFSLYPFSNTTTYITFFSVFTITRRLEQNVSEYRDIIELEFLLRKFKYWKITETFWVKLNTRIRWNQSEFLDFPIFFWVIVFTSLSYNYIKATKIFCLGWWQNSFC